MATKAKDQYRCYVCGKFASRQQSPDFIVCRNYDCIQQATKDLHDSINRSNERVRKAQTR